MRSASDYENSANLHCTNEQSPDQVNDQIHTKFPSSLWRHTVLDVKKFFRFRGRVITTRKPNGF